MPDDDTTTQTTPATATPPPDYLAQLAPILKQLQLTPPPAIPSGTPDDGTAPSWTGLLGRALSGGQAPGYQLRGSQADTSGNRALLNFGINMLLASGPHASRPDLLSAAATGLQGAQESLGQDQQRAGQFAAAQQDYAQKQFENRMDAVKAALPLLRTQQAGAIPNLLATGATPGTATGGGRPGTIAPPAVAYGQGGPGSTIPVPPEYMQYFQDASKRTGVPVDLLIAQARQESGFNPNAAGGGLMQIQDKTALNPGFGMQGVQSPAILKDPKTNINFGADYLAARAKAAGADLSTPQGQAIGLQAYNGGGDPDYVKNVTRYMPKPAGGPAPGQYAGPGVPAGGAPAAPAAPLPVPPAAPAGGAPGAAPAVPGAAPPPAATPPDQPPAPTPPGGQTWEQYLAQHMPKPTPEEQATWHQAPAQATLNEAAAAKATAAQALSGARANFGVGSKEESDAQTRFQAASKDLSDLQQKYSQQNASTLQNWTDKQKTVLAPLYQNQVNKAQEAAEADKQRAATVALKTQEGQNAIELAKITGGQTWHQQLQEQAAKDAQENTIKPMAAASLKAHQMNLGLSQMLPVLQDLPPSGGTLGTVLDAHPDLAPLFNQAGILNDKQADAVRLINGLVSSISTEMKPQGLGALREYEWNAFKAQLPSMLSTQTGQQKAVALLMNMNNRIQSEGSWMSSYYSRKIPDETTPGRMVPAHNLESDNPTESVGQRMDRELGPIVPSYTGPMTGSGQAQWEQSLPPGKPYYKTYAVPDPKNPGQPLRDRTGNVVTTKSLEVRPWQ